jgi:hypothetical protein
MSRWVPGLRAVTSISGPARVGTVYRERTVTTGVAEVRTWEIVEHRRPVRQVRVASGWGLDRRLVLTLDGRGTGTWLRAEMMLRSTLPFGIRLLHEVLSMPVASASARSFVGAAKRVFEGAAPR